MLLFLKCVYESVMEDKLMSFLFSFMITDLHVIFWRLMYFAKIQTLDIVLFSCFCVTVIISLVIANDWRF